MSIDKFLILVLYTSYHIINISSLHVNINYSFKLPEIFGAGNPDDSDCCPHIIYSANETGTFRHPDFLILGVQKSGTTALGFTLGQHPRMRLPQDVKELFWFDGDGIILGSSYLKYVQNWKVLESEKDVLLFEAATQYLLVTIAPCRMKHYLPNIKMIVILRDPAARAYSAYNYLRQWCSNGKFHPFPWKEIPFYDAIISGLNNLQNNECSFNTGYGNVTYNDCYKCLTTFNNRMVCAGRNFYIRTGPGDKEYTFVDFKFDMILHGLYGAQIAWWFHFFKPSQFKFISDVEFIHNNTLGVLNEIVDFVGAEFYYTDENIFSKLKNDQINKYEHKENLDENLDVALDLLKKFYRRPNLELYKLLNDNGHNFKPFEHDIQNFDVIDCSDNKTVNSGICGEPEKLKGLDPMPSQQLTNSIEKKEEIPEKVLKVRSEYIKEEISQYLSKYNISISKNKNGTEYLQINEDGFNISIHSFREFGLNKSNIVEKYNNNSNPDIIARGRNISVEFYDMINSSKNNSFYKMKINKRRSLLKYNVSFENYKLFIYFILLIVIIWVYYRIQ